MSTVTLYVSTTWVTHRLPCSTLKVAHRYGRPQDDDRRWAIGINCCRVCKPMDNQP